MVDVRQRPQGIAVGVTGQERRHPVGADGLLVEQLGQLRHRPPHLRELPLRHLKGLQLLLELLLGGGEVRAALLQSLGGVLQLLGGTLRFLAQRGEVLRVLVRPLVRLLVRRGLAYGLLTGMRGLPGGLGRPGRGHARQGGHRHDNRDQTC
ncbi:hypothetical protein ACFSTC_03755 [Nonomuraea ferruginea]